ncbi:MAG: hypothetical protein AB7O47_12750 [Flavobacteriales bacterium]
MKLRIDKISVKKYAWAIVLITFVVYFNSIDNEYALDDNIVVEGNKNVEQGFAGIPIIFKSRYSTDKKQTYDYRPIVLTSFAIEKQFFSKLPEKQTLQEKKKKNKLTQANISHFFNLILYILLCVLIFRFLLKILPNYQPIFSFLITLIFAVHPTHTEVVCSLKNRDEIFMLIALICSIHFYINYAATNKVKDFFLGLLFAVLALLSKNNGMALIALVPMFLYFIKAKPKQIIIAFFSLLIVYFGLNQLQKLILSENQVRIYEFFENPLMSEGWSIKRLSASLYFSWFYLKMLIFPKDLSFYYGYNQLPIATWSYWQVWVSLFFYGCLGVFGVISLIKRKIEGVAVLFWLGLMAGVNNLVFLLPGLVADRFMFAFSLGFCILIVWVIFKIFKINPENKTDDKNIINGSFKYVILSIVLIYSIRTIARNPDWHDYLTLFETDIEHLTESAKSHALISNTLYPIVAKNAQQNPANVNQQDLQKIIYHYKESIRIDSNYLTSINNLGSVYVNFLRDYESAIKYCERAVELDSNYLEAHFNLAFSYQSVLNYEKASFHYARVIELNPDYLKVYELYNQLLNKHNKVEEGLETLKKIAKKSSKPKNIYVNIGNLYSLNSKGDYTLSIQYFEKAYDIDKTDKILCNHIAKLYQLSGDMEKYNNYVRFCQ